MVAWPGSAELRNLIIDQPLTFILANTNAWQTFLETIGIYKFKYNTKN